MRPEKRFGKIQMAILVVIALIMGANLISPAVGHVKRSIKHLYKHLDKRYYNVGEKVGDANTLDGLDSSAFLRTTGKAADADRLDGIDSPAFLPGFLPGGKTIYGDFYIVGEAQAAGDFSGNQIHFIYRFQALPAFHYILVGGVPPAACPGTFANPQANPGNVCIYEEGALNVSARGIDQPETTGTGLFHAATAAGSTVTWGAWAATAPGTTPRADATVDVNPNAPSQQ
jgi:hypothetical protein